MNLSLRAKASIFLTSALVIASLISTYLFVSAYARSIENNLIERGKALIYSLAKTAEEGMAAENLDLLKKASYIVQAEDVELVQVYDIVWSAIDAYPLEKLNTSPNPEAKKYLASSDRPFYRRVNNSFDFYMPVIFKPSGTSPAISIGFARIVLSAVQMRKDLNQAVITNIAAAALITLLLIIIVNIMVGRLVIDPVLSLSRSMALFKNDRFQHDLPVKSDDEIGRLVSAYNEMGATIREYYNDLQRKMNELEKSEEHFRSVVDTANDAIITVNKDANIISWNHGAEIVFGYSADDVLGKPVAIIIPEHFSEAHKHGMYRLLSTGEVKLIGKTAELTGLRKDGSEFPLELSLAAWKAGGENFFTAVMRDITSRRRLEGQLRQSQKMEAIGTLTGGVAHDFNNILTAIMGYGEFLQDGMAKDDPLRNYVEVIQASARKAAKLVQNLLLFSREQKSEQRVVKLNDIAAKAEGLLERLIGEDIELSIIHDKRELLIMADSGQIEQALMNLAVNARDAMPHGGILTISTGVKELNTEFVKAAGYGKPGQYALISVSDSGIGMDEKTKERIFEPFFTTKGPGKGTGLGLSTVYGIIRQHNGYINVYSEPGKGTTFRIYLPLSETEGEILRKEGEELPAPAGGTETILIAEDNESIRGLLKTTLERAGYRVIEAVDGEDAIRAFNENKGDIHMLLLDVVMPKKNGKEAYDKIKETAPGIKTLFMSGYAFDIVKKKGLLQEGLGYISKPVLPKEMLRKIREIFDKK